MLGIDLSALSSAELKRLLESSRAKGEPEMTAELLREIAHRGVRSPQVRAMTWTPVAAEPSAPIEAVTEPGPGRAAVLALLAAAAIIASAGAGWWLTRPAAQAPAVAVGPTLPIELPAPASPAPLTGQAPVATPTPPPAARPAAPRHVRKATHRHRPATRAHKARRHPAPPPRRHGLLHRLRKLLD
jgi:hypothetical protein